MEKLPELLAPTLRDFAHVEWYEVRELTELINSGRAELYVAALRSQMDAVLAHPAGFAPLANELISNEFASDAEAHAWLKAIYQAVFK